MKKNTIDASIIIIHFGTVDKTLHCITSIYKSKNKKTFEILIIDNTGVNNKKIFNKNKVRYIQNKSDNRGFSSGIKVGLDNAKGEYIVILDNDTEVKKLWLDELLAPFSNIKNVGMTTSEVYDPNAKEFIIGGKLNILGFSYPNKFKPEFKNKEKLFYGITSWCLKKDTLNKLIIDTSYKFFSDDADIGFRTKKLGLEIFPAYKSKVLHFKNKSTGVQGYKSIIRNKDYIAFSYKNLHPIHFLLFCASFLIVKLVYIPFRIFDKNQRNIIDDIKGVFLFINEFDFQSRRKKINDQLPNVSYFKIYKDLSRKLIVTSLVFK